MKTTLRYLVFSAHRLDIEGQYSLGIFMWLIWQLWLNPSKEPICYARQAQWFSLQKLMLAGAGTQLGRLPRATKYVSLSTWLRFLPFLNHVLREKKKSIPKVNLPMRQGGVCNVPSFAHRIYSQR